MASFKLTYFDFAGRGELARLLFTVAGQEFEDHRIQFTEWPAMKETDYCPFKSLPVLTVTNEDGSSFKMGQSLAIGE